MLIGVLLAINIVVCLGLIGVVLLQRSEGGALGMGGGGSTGFMTARGAGDLLTRITWILFSVFLIISLVLTILTGRMNGGNSVVDRLKINNLDAKTLNAPIAPAVPAPAETAPSAAQPGAIQAPTPQVNAPTPAHPAAVKPAAAPAPTAAAPVLVPAEPAKTPAR